MKKEKFKSVEKREAEKITIFTFFALLFGGMLLSLLTPDTVVSKTERRSMAQKPKLSVERILDGRFMEDAEEYALEQFWQRDVFRSVKSEFEQFVFLKKDSEGYYRDSDGIYRMDTVLKENNLIRTANAFSEMTEEHFSDAKVYYAVIPDKNYFAAEENGIPTYDYERLHAILEENMNGISYIDLYDLLKMEDYYATDLHWRQESIVDVAEYLSEEMEAEREPQEYDKVLVKEDFYGGYAGGSAFVTEPDCLYALHSTVIDEAMVYDYETRDTTSVYVPEKLSGTDDYDYFLSGARALLTIENPNQKNGRKLLLFRDSFGSAIAPLMLSAYSEITLVDLRYISSSYLFDMIDADSYDTVLFLYSTTLLNSSDGLKLY